MDRTIYKRVKLCDGRFPFAQLCGPVRHCLKAYLGTATGSVAEEGDISAHSSDFFFCCDTAETRTDASENYFQRQAKPDVFEASKGTPTVFMVGDDEWGSQDAKDCRYARIECSRLA